MALFIYERQLKAVCLDYTKSIRQFITAETLVILNDLQQYFDQFAAIF